MRIGANAKKLVPPLLNRWELLFIPSSVMFIDAFGRPLNVLLRFVSADMAPGANNAKSNVARPLLGKLLMLVFLIVVLAVLEVVSSCTADAVTSISAVASPSFNSTGKSVVRPVLITIEP